jgi:Uma2 family endonuclease
MTTLTEPTVPVLQTPPNSPRPATSRHVAGIGTQQLVLDDISWPQYVAIGDALINRPGLRMTYDRGRLEFMTTSPLHEMYKKRLGRILETLIEVFGMDLVPAGHMTFRRKELERGLEPDDCFWIAHEPQMRANTTWDPTRDPPPDLVIEIEISRSALDRMAIYAALRVPEVWRCDGESLYAELLQLDGTWLRSDTSPTFPGVPLAEIVPFLQPSESRSYMQMVNEFRDWLRSLRSSQQP